MFAAALHVLFLTPFPLPPLIPYFFSFSTNFFPAHHGPFPFFVFFSPPQSHPTAVLFPLFPPIKLTLFLALCIWFFLMITLPPFFFFFLVCPPISDHFSPSLNSQLSGFDPFLGSLLVIFYQFVTIYVFLWRLFHPWFLPNPFPVLCHLFVFAMTNPS